MAKELPWAVTPEKVDAVIKRIVKIGNPLKIILFGSFVAGKMTSNSDLDILIVAGDDIVNPRMESVRIRRALRGISMPMDIVVVPENIWTRYKDQPGMIYREVSRTGKVVYES